MQSGMELLTARTFDGSALPAPPEALVRDTWMLEPPAPHERAHVERNDAGLLVDGLLAKVARGRGALDVAIGEALAALSGGDRALYCALARRPTQPGPGRRPCGGPQGTGPRG
jgi:hypothetical protein